MRFIYGSIPENEGFAPERGRWVALRELPPWPMQLLSLPIGIFASAMVWGAALLLTPLEIPWDDPHPIELWAFVGLILPITPIHELVHVICFPDAGQSQRTIVGIWLSKGVAYAHYEGPMRRERFMLMIAMPFLVLTVAPLLLAALLGIRWWWVGLAAMSNALLSSQDLLVAGMVLGQIPKRVWVRNKGWRTYWRPPSGQTVRRGVIGTSIRWLAVPSGLAAAVVVQIYIATSIFDGYQRADIDLSNRHREFKPGHGAQPTGAFVNSSTVRVYEEAPGGIDTNHAIPRETMKAGSPPGFCGIMVPVLRARPRGPAQSVTL